jgi:hypothetical protein
VIAVCDMGPLHYLVLIGCDHILPQIFDRVITARVVIEREMADPQTPEPVLHGPPPRRNGSKSQRQTSFYVGEKARAVIDGMTQRHQERKLADEGRSRE